jgi:hypothetical protein
MRSSDKYPRVTETKKRALQKLANAPSPTEGVPLAFQTAASLARLGWAEPGSRYPLFRITEAGRLVLSRTLSADFRR